MDKRSEHCAFKKIGVNGNCIANCSQIVLVDGRLVDCLGKSGEGVVDQVKRLKEEAKLH